MKRRGGYRVYLFLALFWLALGLGMLLLPLVAPRIGRFQILDTGISFGWLLLAFSGFNFVKWWLLMRLKNVKMQEQELARTMRRRRAAEDGYDPTFDFSDKEPGHESGAGEQNPG